MVNVHVGDRIARCGTDYGTNRTAIENIDLERKAFLRRRFFLASSRERLLTGRLHRLKADVALRDVAQVVCCWVVLCGAVW